MNLLIKITLPVFLELSFAVAQAQGELPPERVHELCASQAGRAEQIMKARQLGIPMSDVMGILLDNQVWREMVIEAYRINRYDIESIQRRITEDFRDAQYLNCLNDFSSTS